MLPLSPTCTKIAASTLCPRIICKLGRWNKYNLIMSQFIRKHFYYTELILSHSCNVTLKPQRRRSPSSLNNRRGSVLQPAKFRLPLKSNGFYHGVSFFPSDSSFEKPRKQNSVARHTAEATEDSAADPRETHRQRGVWQRERTARQWSWGPVQQQQRTAAVRRQLQRSDAALRL